LVYRWQHVNIFNVIAIKEATIYVESIHIKKALIISDSLSALTSLLSSNPSNLTNEEVDLLANQAILSAESTVINSLPYKDLSRIINLISNQQWQSQWDRTSDKKLKNIKNHTEMAIPHKHSP